ncbi:MAG: hypothetical protein Q4P25_01280 [Tissierellia bacterium]|nr:hypothetical protein [Tissierellia bacterium]
MRKFLCSFVALYILFMVVACQKSTNVGNKDDSDRNIGPVSQEESPGIDEHRNPHMVMIDGQLYQDMGYINSAVTCGTADGEIISSVEFSEVPRQDDESNFGKGYEYQRWDKAHVQVMIDDKWVIFQNIAISDFAIPSCVANVKGKIIEIEKDRLLVTITDIPEEFKWIFKVEDKEKIKPISLPIENLSLKHLKQEMDLKESSDQVIQIWFDGSIKYNEPEMTKPIELGEIYKITRIEE